MIPVKPLVPTTFFTPPHLTVPGPAPKAQQINISEILETVNVLETKINNSEKAISEQVKELESTKSLLQKLKFQIRNLTAQRNFNNFDSNSLNNNFHNTSPINLKRSLPPQQINYSPNSSSLDEDVKYSKKAKIILEDPIPCEASGCDKLAKHECSSCKNAFYCSLDCQISDWNRMRLN